METTNLIPATAPTFRELANQQESGNYPMIPNTPNSAFLEGPSSAISLKDLSEKSIIPYYHKDFEPSISHQEFISTVMEACRIVFGEVSEPEIRVSHEIRAIKPEAINKPRAEITERDQTRYFERMCFLNTIPSITTSVNGQQMNLSVFGVRSYQNVKFHSAKGKTGERFSIGIGGTVKICSNQCLTTSGTKLSIQCNDTMALLNEAIGLFSSFKVEETFRLFNAMQGVTLSESQFCSVLGHLRLLNAMPTFRQKHLPTILLGDANMNSVARLAVEENNPFKLNDDGSISLWNFHNLLTESIKNSYIDTVLPKWTNATDLTVGLAAAIEGISDEYSWFLS